MGRHTQDNDDITKQHYRGPGPTVAGLGEGALQAKFLTIGGLIVGGVAAAVFPKQTSQLVAKIQTGVENATKSENGFKKILGDFGKFTLDIGKHTAEAFTKSKVMKSKFGDPEKSAKIARIVDGAIITSAAGSIIGVFTGGTRGVMSARAGKKQFDAAKEEILDLRKKVIDKETEISDLKTALEAKKGKLKVAADAPKTKIHSPIIEEHGLHGTVEPEIAR